MSLKYELCGWQGHKAEYPEVLTGMMDIEDLGNHGTKHTVSITPTSPRAERESLLNL